MSVLLQTVPLILLISAAALWIWSGVWAHRDAELRGKPPMLVSLLVLLLSWPISLLVWIALRPPLLRRGFNLNDFKVQ